MQQKPKEWYVVRDGEPVELRPDTLKTEDAADEYARLVALTHPKSRIELRDNSGIVREYGPMGSKPDHA